MKPINRLYLSSDEIHVVDANLMLELSACGRGFITAETTTDYTGKLVRLDVGYTDLILRWFTGYVERAQPAQNGYQRLFVRELVGVFDRQWPCSFQHPTLRQIVDWLQEHSGLTFILPEAPYTDKPVPHYTHNGTGYQLLANLGQVFDIEDYIWQQLPDGSVYLGSWVHSLFAGKPVDIPNEFSQRHSAGNAMTIPMIQSLRPGVVVNQQRLSKVNLTNENMAITWLPKGQQENKTPAQRQIDAAYPELSAGLHLPQFARIEAHTENTASGDISDPFRPRYAVDVQLLDDNGKDAAAPVYQAVPLPLPMAGGESGMFQYPPIGTIVEMAFEGGRPDKPFIRQTLSQGNTLPDIKPGEQLQQQRAEVSQRVTQEGSWIRQTDQTINESSLHREVKADTEKRTVVARETTIQATDKVTVLGTSALLAGAIQHIADGDYSLAASSNLVASVGKDANIDVGQTLIEKIGLLRQSIAGVKQEIVAPVVWVGSQQINVMQLMLDTLGVVKELAELTAAHTHHNTGTPENASAIRNTADKSDGLKQKYSPVIG
ncbi:phage baseplate assembly protein V [Xenorhabdus sp. Sc-CR9]|uniref:phage baseplate assembly protein V n=1 Tax=Xenorhabdus sp. Sc-CR9 TaxID=2584468 RepID=UPI001F32689A|nr:phage baseplate assembly protein V [Xenorhabdus sp. Sc-CR9]